MYDSDPKLNPNAKKFDTLSIQEVVDRKLGVIDMTASVMCMENKMPLVIFGLNGFLRAEYRCHLVLSEPYTHELCTCVGNP
mgnify:CR=1 FL=1